MDDSHRTWGKDLCIICGCDEKFLPGAYALFNSAIVNGFKGEFKFLLSEEMDTSVLPKHIQLSFALHPVRTNVFKTVPKLSVLPLLPNGNYLMLDADFIIERPCGHLLEPITAGLLVSTEPESKYDPYDVLVYQQCLILGMSLNLKPYGYINSGFLGFSLPRDKFFLEKYAEFSFKHLQGVHEVFSHQYFHFPEQDILNLLIRQRHEQTADVYSLSPKQIEIGPFNSFYQDRPFPYTKQIKRQIPDRVKYFIHGASMRRPWITIPQAGSLKSRLIGRIKSSSLADWLRKPESYERAWACYACSENMPISISTWAEHHAFTGHKSWLWRKAYGLD